MLSLVPVRIRGPRSGQPATGPPRRYGNRPDRVVVITSSERDTVMPRLIKEFEFYPDVEIDFVGLGRSASA
jgi:hypothetical protein